MYPIYKLKLLNTRNFIKQVRRPKGVSVEREAYVSRGAEASAALVYYKNAMSKIEKDLNI